MAPRISCKKYITHYIVVLGEWEVLPVPENHHCDGRLKGLIGETEAHKSTTECLNWCKTKVNMY